MEERIRSQHNKRRFAAAARQPPVNERNENSPAARVRSWTRRGEQIVEWNVPVTADTATTQRVIQFDWRRHWKNKVEPFLQHELVQKALELGMGMFDSSWKSGDAPYLSGNPSGERPVRGKLSWYRPTGRCHWIAFFSMAIGVLNFPELDWQFLTGDLHTVPVGFDAEGQPRVLMDLLLFDQHSAEECIALTKVKPPAHLATPERARFQFDTLYRLFVEHHVPAIRAAARAQR